MTSHAKKKNSSRDCCKSRCLADKTMHAALGILYELDADVPAVPVTAANALKHVVRELVPLFLRGHARRATLAVGPCQLHRHNGRIFDTEDHVLPCNALPGTHLGCVDEDFWDVESFWEF